MENKLIPFGELPELIEKLRRKKKKDAVVLCHGCFDIVHPGHIRHLKFARAQGSFLIVSITPDVCVSKGSGRPYVPQELRAENLAALEIVNAVTIAPADTGIEPIKNIKPDIYVKGREYAFSRDPRFLKEKKLVSELGGRVVYSSGDVVFSSSEFIRDFDLNTAEKLKLSYICGRYGVNRESLDNILNSASNGKFLIFGDAVLDEYKFCEGIGIAQETPVMSISLKHKSEYIGGAGGIALHLAAMGADVSFLTSADMAGRGFRFFNESLNDFNISLSVIEDKGRVPAFKSHYFVQNNQVLELEDCPYRPVDSTLKSKIVKEFKKEIKNCPDCVIISDFGFGLLAGDVVDTLADIARSKKIPVFSDISMTLRTQLEKFSGSDFFSATEMELRSCMHDFESGLSVLVEKFYLSGKIKELYLTLSDGSALYFRRPRSRGIHNMESAHIPNLLTNRTDEMGRGEAFTAGVALARTAGANEVQSIYMGSVFGAVNSGKLGNHPVIAREVHHLLDERTELNAENKIQKSLPENL